jgi:phosphoribosylanthranilate isomerase
MDQVRVKICGLRTLADVQAVADAGAAYMGLVFFPKSPRNLTLAQGQELALAAPVGLAKVALVVNPDDDALDAIVEAMPLDMIQLHGQESPDRVAAVRARYGLPVMKAMGVAEEDDLSGLMEMSLAADQLLIDAKPAKGELPGGNGLTFDWRLLVGRKWLKPWMLAGGLHAGNVAEAVRLTGARQVDLSSGVESAPGVKDHGKIREFMAAVRGG